MPVDEKLNDSVQGTQRGSSLLKCAHISKGSGGRKGKKERQRPEKAYGLTYQAKWCALFPAGKENFLRI